MAQDFSRIPFAPTEKIPRQLARTSAVAAHIAVPPKALAAKTLSPAQTVCYRNPVRFPQHHERRFICMQDLICKKLFVQCVIYRQEPALSGIKNPVGHGLPGNGQTEPAQLLLLPVKRERKHIFAMHDLRQQTGRYDPTARQKRGRNGAFLHGNTGFLFFALTAAIRCLDMLCELVLCGDIRQFPPQNAVSAGVQRSAALWTAALLLRLHGLLAGASVDAAVQPPKLLRQPVDLPVRRFDLQIFFMQ